MRDDGPLCRGSWALGSACGKCRRCMETRPDTAGRQQDLNDLLQKAFITSVSGFGKYKIEMQFETMQQMHAAHDAIIKLLKAAPSKAGRKE